MNNKNNPAVSVWKPDKSDFEEIYLLEGLPMFTQDISNQLIKNGWRSDLFQQIESIATRCDNGHVVAFYNERRNSILIPSNIDGMEVTYEITQTQFHVHTLGINAAQQSVHLTPRHAAKNRTRSKARRR